MADAATDGARGGGVELGGAVEQIGVELQLELTDECQRTRAARVQQRQQTQSSSSPIAGARDVTRDVIRCCIRSVIAGIVCRR